MNRIKTFLVACALLASMNAIALPMTATLTANGSLDYIASGIEGQVSVDLDSLFGPRDWTYYGTLDWSTSVVGSPPGFSEPANWFLSVEGYYDYEWQEGTTTGGDDNLPGESFGPIPLGYGSVDDLLNVGSYGAILSTLGGLLSSTPNLTQVLVAVNSILEPAFQVPGFPPQITSITDNIFFHVVDSDTIGFASNLGLTIDHDANTRHVPDTAHLDFGGSLTLQAVPVPGIIYLFAIGLAGVFVSRVKRPIR